MKSNKIQLNPIKFNEIQLNPIKSNETESDKPQSYN